MVLSVAVAALVAAWLPFSLFYIDALSKHTASVAAPSLSASTTPSGKAPAVQTAQSPTPGCHANVLASSRTPRQSPNASTDPTRFVTS